MEMTVSSDIIFSGKFYSCMKKHLVAIAGACAAMVLSSCENLNEDFGIGGAEEVTIHASVAEQPVDTKSAIDEFGSEKVTFKWLAGDAISVFFGDSEGSIFVTDVTASKAKFKGTIGAVMGGGDDLTDETSLWGVYPYDKNTSCDGSSITLTLPNEQGAVADTFADDLFPSIARSTNFTMAFYPVCGSIRFKVSDPEIVKVTLSGNNGEDLAGKATVSMPLGGAPVVDVVSEGQKELVMKAPDGGCFDTSKYYYFVMYPTDFTKGLTITYYKEDEKASYVLNSSVKLGRNRFMSATNKDSGLTYSKITSAYDYIDEYGINHGPGVEIDGIMWAPVNCGYHKTDYPYGKLYQWGRKYGQGYDENDATYPSVEAGTIKEGGASPAEGQSETNKDIFFLGVPDVNNWTDSWMSYCTLWNSGTESAPVKNVDNDPCPSGWRVPTYAELSEFMANHSDWTVDELGHCGYWFSGASSYTEGVSQVFLPAAGYRHYYRGLAGGRDCSGYYWSSESGVTDSYCIVLGLGGVCVFTTTNPCAYGYSVRCVKDANSSDNSGDEEELVIPVSSVTLSSTSLKLYEGDKAILTAKVMPTDATNQKVTWSSDAPGVAYVDQDGEVTAISEGSAKITATADGVSKTCTVTVSSLLVATANYVDEYGKNHGKGVAIGSAIWAPVNCGYHETDYPYGKLYQWGRKYGQGYSGPLYVDGENTCDISDATYPTVEDGTIKEGGVSLAGGQSQSNKDVFFLRYVDNNNDWVYPSDSKLWNSGTEENPVKTDNDPCPEGWRVPTYNELNELKSNHSSWTKNAEGRSGYWFSGASTYAEGVPQIFLPAAGIRNYSDGSAGYRGRNGDYWSSRPLSYNAYNLYFIFGSSNAYMADYGSSRAYGYSVRCVQE